ncbi:P-loop containing nucleoside triphosphate hydrolase protein [Roridomyces roridus]|uniref:RNA helicase n=1 Tax=Roridomyces roridus TaxID=1738132 RepID=A0AAD7FUQ7_9AGAR|nr:P-loop containing nucleoside triphosphate hydrolase protein [Roridomyces roridus]
MSTHREKFNSKARQSTAGSRKKGKTRNKNSDTVADPNADIVVPKTKEQQELDRKEKLRAELEAQSDSKWNAKKRKRLDKYIEKKLKKEERLVIFEKLSQSQATLPTTLHLQSSATLGTGKSATHQDRLDKLEDKEIRRALDGRAGQRRRRQEDSYAVTGPDLDMDDDEPDDEPVAGPSSLPKASAVGSALQRNPDGTVVAPKVVPRSQGKKSAFKSWKDRRNVAPAVESDSSFDSSDSGNDSPEDKDGFDSSESEEDDAGDQEEPAEAAPAPTKRSFKEWALKQLSIAKGVDAPVELRPPEEPSTAAPPPRKKQKTTHSNSKRGPLGEDLQLPSTAFAQHVLHSSSPTSLKSVPVSRPDDVNEARVLLPIVAEEQPIMEAILLNPVVIICGETGSGKTTQVPQFLYEAGFGSPGSDNPGMIGITQPRRVAAMSMAARVAHELSLPSSRVSYQIRYDATVSPTTCIKFMTDGVLLRELATDFLLTKYSVVIIDEAHERSMNTDILIGVLSRVLKLREDMWKNGTADIKPLRLVIMSATLRVSDFAENKTLFPTPPPVINVAARQHPVTIHFNRRTFSDYVTEAVKKTTKIHTRLPPGGILIFLTGQNEITGVCRKLEAKFGAKALERKRRMRQSASNAPDQPEATAEGLIRPAQADVEAEDLDLGEQQIDDLALDVDADMDEDQDPDALDSDEDTEEHQLDRELGLDSDEVDATPMHIVPLYSLLPSEKQMLVFKPPPEGSRLVVVSTNVAETSLTIPGIRYVVDCGRAKERRYDIANGVQAFQVSWVSKASAAQRAGRAGRTGPGHCYRLYSSALFEHQFDKFSKPEILRMPIEGVVLQMKSMHIDAVVNFPFPTPPDRATLSKAEKVLGHLGALGDATSVEKGISAAVGSSHDGQITELGRLMSLFPLSPRFSRMLVSGQQQGCLPFVISIVSALSVGDPFLHDETLTAEDDDDEDTPSDRARRKAFFTSQHTHSALGNFTSDIFRILSVVGAYEFAGGGHQFCVDHFVRLKAMEEIHKLRAQISNIVRANFPAAEAGFTSKLLPPNELQLKVIRQLLTAGFIDQVAVRKDCVQQTASSGVKYSTSKGVAYKALGVSEDVFIHPSSVLANSPPPEYVVFSELLRTSRVWIKGVTVINPAWLSSLANDALCTFSKPTKNIAGEIMVTPRFGPDGWELPPIKAQNARPARQ